jgi:FkbM family methyltransferase
MLQNIDALASFVAKIRLIQRFPSFLQTWFMKLQLFTKLRAKKVNCQVKTISQIIREHNIKHGIKLEKGNTVFDVGANIGMFSLYCCELCENEVDIYAFEPIPEIFQILQKNVERLNLDKINIYNFGISNRNEDTVIFDYFRNATGFSTMYPEKPEKLRKSVRLIMLQNIDALASFVAKISLIRRLPSFLQTLSIDLQLFTKLRAKKVNCQVKTISQIIREHNIKHIDLLKIDVEKSELDVLLGIDERD